LTTKTRPSPNGNDELVVLEAAIELQPLDKRFIDVPIEGVTPYIANNWSQKALTEIRDKQMGKAKTKKAPKVPEDDYKAARYRLDDERDGIPASAFKSAIVEAAGFYNRATITQTLLKRAVVVIGEGPDQLVPLDVAPIMREDAVRIAMGTTDLRYRPMYWPWKATLSIEFVASVISPSTVFHLVDAAGLGGVGEWRPSAPKSKTGSYGRFRVAR
jgi:hypothetical protein